MDRLGEELLIEARVRGKAEGGLRGVLLRWSLALSLLLSLTGTAFPIGGSRSDRPPRCSNLDHERRMAFDTRAMRAALAELTHWDVTRWEAPQIDQLTPEAFEAQTHLNHHRFLGEYEPKTNRVFINLDCRCQVPDQPEAFCEVVLFHELVHWGQHQSGLDKTLGSSEQERQALNLEIQYLQTRLGLVDTYPPPPPTLAELPPLRTPVRLTQRRPRVFVEDAAGKRQWLWIITGTWSEIPALKDYQGQAISHRGHWVGVEIFEVNPSTGTERIEAWWDAGYVRPDNAFPADPVYEGRWVRVK